MVPGERVVPNGIGERTPGTQLAGQSISGRRGACSPACLRASPAAAAAPVPVPPFYCLIDQRRARLTAGVESIK